MRNLGYLSRRLFGGILLGFVALAMAGCIETSGGGPRVDPNRPVVVAMLVPQGSGQPEQEALANALVAAARMAAAEIPEARIDLRVYPTAGDPARAAAVASEAAADGAKIILGPLFAAEAVAVGKAVAGRGINVLSFSNNPDVAGSNVFILGDTFFNVADRLMGYAARQGKRSVAALARADAAGDIALDAVARAARAHGVDYVGAARYELNAQSAVAAVGAVRDLVARTGASALAMDADAAGALPVFAQLLPENGLTAASTQFIGLTRWDQTAEQIRSNPGLQGSLFALPDTSANAAFESRFTATYGTRPHILAGKAYDGMRAIATLLASGDRAALTRERLTNPAGFAGAGGVFRFRPDGTVQRALAVATLRDGQIVVLDPAPRGFGAAGY